MASVTRARLLDKAAELAKKTGYVFISTADGSGRPHLAVARSLEVSDESRVDVREWFCPGTMANLKDNPRVSVVVWEPAGDTGYQLTGEMERMTDTGVLDGYTAEMDDKWPVPQVESRLVVKVNKVTDFKRAPHSDIEE